MLLELVGKMCLTKKASFIGNIGDGEVLSKQFPCMRYAYLNLISDKKSVPSTGNSRFLQAR